MYILYENRFSQNLLRKECAFIYVKFGCGKVSINRVGHIVFQGYFIRIVGKSSISMEGTLKYITLTFNEIYFENYIEFLEKNQLI